jgi:uncharacterized protein (TIGR03663 family)
MNRRFALGFLLALGAAVALRAPQLDRRPMHNDEAVNALKFRALWQQGSYRYDPNEFHGPTLAYATLASAWLTPSRTFNQFTETTFRLVPVAFGLGLILLLALLADGLGRAETLWAAVFTAVSPAMVFYSRYYIHELLLVFFSGLVIAAGWRYGRTRQPGWCVLAGVGLGLMYATKETFVLAVAAMGAAVAGVVVWSRWREGRRIELKAFVNRRCVGGAIAAGLLVSVALFSSFFTNPSGPLDSIRTYLPWAHRAGGNSPHEHAWPFYFHRLIYFHRASGPVWSEAAIFVLAGFGLIAAFARRELAGASVTLVRALGLYSVALTLVYTIIAYKTPWCLLGFWHGMILLAGVGAVALIRWRRTRGWRVLITGLLSAATVHLAWQAWRASYPYCASPQNPYVYSPTSPDLLNLVDRIRALEKVSAEGPGMVIKVMARDGDYWPLPWYLREFKKVGWWDQIPAAPFAPVMIVSAKFQAAFDERVPRTHLMAGYFQLRPQVFLELYVDVNLWRAYVASRPPSTD